MQRITCSPRTDWQNRVEKKGLVFHTSDSGRPYWNECAYYSFTRAEIDTLEKTVYELDRLCLQAVEHALRHTKFAEFQISPDLAPWLARSWETDEFSIYGRFDLVYDGINPPKLLEFNADTPTALLETAVIQWFWLQDVAPDADQFNSLHERLMEAWRAFHAARPQPVTFVSAAGHVEDYVTVNYLRDVAVQADVPSQYLTIQQIGWNAARKAFVDLQERELACVFKLYPWEWMLREQFGQYLTWARTRWLEPPWKILLSNKALLPLLWELFPGHPNLLPASWQPLEGSQVRKPARGREGANVAVLDGQHVQLETSGPYGAEPCIYQQFHEPPRFDGRWALCGCWLVNGYACGLGMREDDKLITTNTSRFVPHLFR